MDAASGGATAFHHPALKGLAVQPEQGAALVFFPAFGDGRFDARMTHSGEPVVEGEKWIINTWAMQYSRPSCKNEL
jgi:prolyl 4-hydroxylase